MMIITVSENKQQQTSNKTKTHCEEKKIEKLAEVINQKNRKSTKKLIFT